jgi:hypothetical protein
MRGALSGLVIDTVLFPGQADTNHFRLTPALPGTTACLLQCLVSPMIP